MLSALVKFLNNYKDCTAKILKEPKYIALIHQNKIVKELKF